MVGDPFLGCFHLHFHSCSDLLGSARTAVCEDPLQMRSRNTPRLKIKIKGFQHS